MEFKSTSPTDVKLELPAETLAAQGIELLDPKPVIAHVQNRFGFADDLFDEFLFLRSSDKLIRAVSRPLAIPAGPIIDRVGIDFLRTKMINPCMTTSAAMTWGAEAITNVVDTDRDQCETFLRRDPIRLTDRQLEKCTQRGFVLIRHLTYGLGVGFLESTRPTDDYRGRVRSMYPGAFSADLQQTSPFGNPL